MITLLAKMTVKPGREADFEARFALLAAKVLASETGTRLYKLTRSQQTANEYHIVEFYESADALARHKDNLKAEPLMAGIGETLDARPELLLLDDVSPA